MTLKHERTHPGEGYHSKTHVHGIPEDEALNTNSLPPTSPFPEEEEEKNQYQRGERREI